MEKIRNRKKIIEKRKVCCRLGIIFFLIGGGLSVFHIGTSIISFVISILATMKMMYWDLKEIILFELNKRSK